MTPPDVYDVTVAYRVYPGVSKTPLVFADDKLKLTELCLRSFRESLGSLRVKMLVLLDACPPEYVALFQQYFAAPDLVIIPISARSNRASFGRQIRLLLDQEYSELVYFAEDDYLYLPDQFASMVRFMRGNDDVDFATPYDHLHYYTSRLHWHKKRSAMFETRQWRTVASTCLTFLTSRTVLRHTEQVFQSYVHSRKNTDFGVWFSLTKYRIRNPITPLMGLTGQSLPPAAVALAWFYGWRQVLFGRKWCLWAPVPTIATHIDAGYLSPGYDWRGLVADEVRSLGRTSPTLHPTTRSPNLERSQT